VALSAFDSFCRHASGGKFPNLHDRDNLWRLLVTITARKVYQLRLSSNRQKRGGDKGLDRPPGSSGHDSSAVYGIDQFIAYEPTPQFAAQAAEEYQRLLARLKDARLQALAQMKMEGYTNEEIAAKEGCAPRTIERRLRLIRSLLVDTDEA